MSAVRRRVEHVMGMPISLALRGRHAETTQSDEAWNAVLEQLRWVDRVFSTYRADSLVSRIDRGELSIEECPPELNEVLALGAKAETESGGRFSVWLPDGRGARRLDPSGVVKGWAAQRASGVLAALDDTDFCLSAGGDMVCHVADPGRPAWRIGVEDPSDPQRILAVIPVRDGAVATSGATHRGSHIVDPRTPDGEPVAGVASVTVVGTDLTWADIDATAAYAHGRQAADWLRGRALVSALVVWPDGSTTVVGGRPAGRLSVSRS
jgi:thiamine biosynthesis lipoprotein